MARHAGVAMRKYGAKQDANCKAIVEALRNLKGVAVVYVGKPLDLVVGYAGRNYFIEIKNQGGKDQRGPSWETQKTFISDWPGQASVCKSVAQVCEAIGYWDETTQE